ncbi:1-acyl-sn-glycerol-3-phosphate acyltransferase [Mangrovimonas xylaniphaga]|uniref:1-acyl-sn-glycerol-3-phosphate acyltransferase n=1 Tax=Mangrovimonas xylaniphaga TaxID=1645915 RepID=UPI001F0A0C13|nr:1-acyl-sn-glycerol-3-phosphate acyltransferase [Mangrovimonas xylaniphaga]
MNKIWLFLVRSYIKLGLFFYYRRISVAMQESIPKDEAVIFLGNHQNALMDALIIAVKNGRFVYFLTRASVFSNPLVAKILRSLWMLPVYRVRDGWNTISKNDEIFKTCSKLLHSDNAVTIFPEGNHNLKRMVRPLSKGFTRIVFETLERYPDTKLSLIPVGINYENAEGYANGVFLNFGKTIEVTSKDTMKSPNMAQQIKTRVHEELCALTTHIDSEHYENTLQRLEEDKVDFLNPIAANQYISSNFDAKNLQTGRQDGLPKGFFMGLLKCVLLPTYLVWKHALLPKIKEREFVATFRFAVAITLIPLYLILTTLLVGGLWGAPIAGVYFTGILLIALLAVKL